MSVAQEVSCILRDLDGEIASIRRYGLTINILRIENGHVYYKTTQNNHGGLLNLGNLGKMSDRYPSSRDRPNDLPSSSHSTKPPITSENDPSPSTPPPQGVTPPKGFIQRDQEWFSPGRVLEIHCPTEPHIHRKQFVLLDTKNVAGPALYVRHYTDEQCEHIKGSFHRNHVLLVSYVEKEARPQPNRRDRRKIVYMDDSDEEETVPNNTWIELEHVYT
ncbi:hypothetical protein H2200_007610 [Cladophialophora chaetospira]|uniref:Uncharacterized protein n=1 Tax=Cladophialophora chaetospira TaxID=386627 RepID=A0AA38X631_9EURO|nr:hypothetical protein H2200_007610 [Cladophialophora chaetospira]